MNNSKVSKSILDAKQNAIIKHTKDKFIEEKELLNKNEFYLSKAQEMSKIGTWELDLFKNELFWTKQNYINFGVPVGTPLTYDIFIECIHPDDRDYVNREWMAAINGKPYDIEHRLIVDGTIRWIREKANVEFNKSGEAIKAIGFSQDITDMKYKDRSIAESEIKFQTIAENSPDSIIIHDLDMNILEVNKKAVQQFGYSKKELLKMRITDLHPKTVHENIKRVSKSIKEKDSLTIATEFIRKDKTIFIAEITPSKYNFEGRQIIYVIIRDISEQKKTKEDLIKQLEKFQIKILKMEQKNDLLDSDMKVFVGREMHIIKLEREIIALKEN